MRRGLLGITIVVMACGGLTGCGRAMGVKNNLVEEQVEVTETGNKKEMIELTVWTDGSDQQMFQEMIDSFQEHYKEEASFAISFEQTDVSSMRGKLLEDIHKGADVITIADDQLPMMVAGGALDCVPNAEQIIAADLEDAIQAATINNKLYAYPMTADNGYFMYYDKDFFSETDVQSLDTMLEKAGAAGKKVTMDWGSGWYLFSFFGNTGLEFGINPDGVTNYCGWNSTEGKIKGSDIIKSMLKISENKGFLNANDGGLLAGARDGSVVAGISGTWNITAIKDIWGEDYGAVKLPTYTCGDQQVQMASFIGYKMMAVNYYSKNKEWAHKLAQWLTNEENQMKRLEQCNQAAANKKVAEAELAKSIPAIQAISNQRPYGQLQKVGNNYWSAMSWFSQIVTTGDTKNLGLQEIADELVNQITASTVQ